MERFIWANRRQAFHREIYLLIIYTRRQFEDENLRVNMSKVSRLHLQKLRESIYAFLGTFVKQVCEFAIEMMGFSIVLNNEYLLLTTLNLYETEIEL